MVLATAMVKHAFDHKQSQTKDIVRTSKAQIKAIDKQIDAVLTRIMDATNETIIGTYEKKIATLEKDKRLLTENMTNQAAPKATFEEKLEPVLQFLANPHKLWEKGSTALRRTILKLAFADHIQYDRFEGPRAFHGLIESKGFPFYAISDSLFVLGLEASTNDQALFC